MKAYVFAARGLIEERSVKEPVLDPADPKDRTSVILEPVYLSPCTSDVHTVFAGKGPRREGLVLGHEGLARVVEAGPDVKDFRPGELAAVCAIMPDVPDGTGHEGSPFSGNKLGRNIEGEWQERFKVPMADENLARIPQRMRPETALMSVDMLATGYSAAEAAGIKPGMTVAVFGTGAVGLMAILSAKLFGAGEVIAVGSETRPLCTELALKFGASCVLSQRDLHLLAGEGELVPGKTHVDRCIICGGPKRALVTACDAVCYGTGVVVNCAYIEGEGSVELPIFSLGRGMSGKTFKFVLSKGGRNFLEKMLMFADRLREEGTDIGVLVTHRTRGLGSVPEALRMMHEKPEGLVKVMVEV